MAEKSTLPTKGTHCGLRPDPDAPNAGIDFEKAKELLKETSEAALSDSNSKPSKKPAK